MTSARRTSGRRLAAAVTAALAATAVGGALPAAPAVAAPVTTAPAQPRGATVALPADAEIVSAGATGFMTSRPDGAGGESLAWTDLATETTTPLPGSVGHDSHSDVAVTSDGATYYTQDMTTPGTPTPGVDLTKELGPDAAFVGAVGNLLFATKPDSYGKLDLYRLFPSGGTVHKQKISYGTRNTGYRIVASSAADAFVLGTAENGGTSYFSTTYKLSGGALGGLYDYTRPVGKWPANATGGISSAYQVWTERASTTTEAVVYDRADYTTNRFPLGSHEDLAVAGVVGHWFLYGLPGGIRESTTNPLYSLTARSLTDASQVKLLDHVTSSAVAPDGSVLVRGGTLAEGEGLYRISDTGGTPTATMIASTGAPTALQFVTHEVPGVMDGDQNAIWTTWAFSRPNVSLTLTLRHVPTGRTSTQRAFLPLTGERIPWNGVMDDDAPAPNGDYTWEAVATPGNGIGGPVAVSGSSRLVRRANAHDFTDNGSADLLARDASGTLWRDDTYDHLAAGELFAVNRVKVGAGFQAYGVIEGAGDLAGGPAADFVARDSSGVLWSFLGKGDGTFANRTGAGGGWNAYNKIAAGSDLTGDGRPDLVAVDAAGALWLHKATGDWKTPYAPRVKLAAGGFNTYDRLTAVGDVAGGAAGDVVARDTTGVLWLFPGKGDGTFLPRVRIGGGWNAFSQLVGMGDADNDGRADLLAYGSGGTYVYLGTGTESAPFTRISTSLYRGEGTKFDSVS
ncbi:FG-GAP repeat domain-containing protein [Streptomyces sp. NPDC007872]|uniref:FG-GAP repeat domain-containing protein n=1 Tax=Streptomyces sp. NPDC007872 TaxID=3364782 RepID=UPI0036ACF27B